MNIKKIMPLFAIAIAVMLAVTTSGFKAQVEMNEATGPQAVAWFSFTGDPSSLTQLQDNTLYEYIGGQPCSGQNVICAVNYSGVAASGHHPNSFAPSFKSRIADVFNGTTASDPDISEED